MKDFVLKDACPDKCNHRFTNKKSSIKFINHFMTMTYPRTFYGVCICCGKSFKFQEDEKGNITRIEED